MGQETPSSGNFFMAEYTEVAEAGFTHIVTAQVPIYHLESDVRDRKSLYGSLFIKAVKDGIGRQRLLSSCRVIRS
jgi:hypothetical protein